MPDYKAVPAGELQVTAQLPFWGDVSPHSPCGAWTGFSMLDQTRTDGETLAGFEVSHL